MITLVHGGTVIDCITSEPRPDTDVLIEDGRIRDVARSLKVSDRAAIIVDATGKFVLPGLIDLHTHCAAPSDEDARRPEGMASTTLASVSSVYGLANLRALVTHGVTTIRDVGSYADTIFVLKRWVDAGILLGPSIIPCGMAIAQTGGHGHGVIAVEADGPDAVRAAVRGQIARGALAIKLMASGSGASEAEDPSHLEFTVEELAAGVEAAQAARRTVVAHSNNAESTMRAVTAGVGCIEHMVHTDDQVLHAMKNSSVGYVPTLWIFQYHAQFGEAAGLVSGRQAAVIAERCESQLENVRAAHALGIRIGAGSDDGVLGTISPWAVQYELEWLVRAGLSPFEALKAATVNAATIVAREDHIGALAPGLAGDVLIVDDDPLANIGHLRRVSWVLRAGTPIVAQGHEVPHPLLAFPSRPDGPIPGAPHPNRSPQEEGSQS